MYGFTSYAPLWCKSNFSFLEGASHPDELVDEAHRLGLKSMALTDRDGVYGIVRAHLKAGDLGIKLITGSEITVNDGTTIVLLASNKEGYTNLCRLISKGRLDSPKGRSRVSWRDVCLHAKGLLALWGGARSLLARNGPDPDDISHDLISAFGDRLYAMIARHRRAEETREEPRVLKRAERHRIPLAAAAEILYHSPSRRPLQDVLTCIRRRVTLATAGRLTMPNAEHHLRSSRSFASLFADIPAAVALSLEISERCDFSLDQMQYRYPSERGPDGTSSFEQLYTLTFAGASKRYEDDIPIDVRAQIERELALIDELDYPGYFLTMHEIVSFCRERGILCQGRGSAANSAVCFCLGITAVDPVRMNLLFERFISRERAEPPDIDLDIEHDRREEVIQHVYQKYGRDHAAMVAVVIRYRPKSAVRDVGKVLGIPETSLDRLARLLSRFSHVPREKMEQAGLRLSIPAHALLLEIAGEILDFPRHLSIHPGGFLLGRTPVHDLVPIENAAMPDRTVIQWDKDDVEALGLFKVDLLGLGALTHLKICFDLIERHRGFHLSMATIPADDPDTFDMICRGETVGVFQIESRAQMAMLPRLRPRNFYDLVVEVSIVRPGPITGGMVHPYLRRRKGQEPVTYPHPSLEPVLEKTLGIPLFQEQVMKLAMVAADYTPGEADQLRRDMGAWRRSGRIESHRERLVSRMTAKGIEPEFAIRVFEQIRGFGEYGFPESHAASFALISYATAYLRCHYPAEFTCGLLNAQPMGFYMPSTIVTGAKRMGVEVRPVDVTRSEWDCTLEEYHRPGSGQEPLQAFTTPTHAAASHSVLCSNPSPSSHGGGPGRGLRMGLRYVKGLSRDAGEKILLASRERPFESLADFARRTGLNSDAMARLSEAGAFRAFDISRRAALWKSRGLARERGDTLQMERNVPVPSFEVLGPFDTIAWDYRAAHHSTSGHPLAPLRDQLNSMNLPDARRLSYMKHESNVRYAGMVICRQRPSTASGVVFMTLEDETGFVNLVCWKDVFARHEVMARTSPFLGVTGELQIQDGVTHLIVKSMWRPQLELHPESTGSRDFK